MPVNYVKKTNRSAYDKASIESAITDIQTNGFTLWHASRMYGVPRSTLERHLNKKLKQTDVYNLGRGSVLGREAEDELAAQILLLASRGFGLTRLEVRQLAYDYVECNNIPNTFNKENKSAGNDWLKLFLRRHTEISLRKPEGLSMARAMGMNRFKVAAHFDLLQETLSKYDFGPNHIYNVDETGLVEVHKPPKILAEKGKKDIHSITSGERGTTTTVLCCCNAAGDYVTPFIIFKGTRQNPSLSKGAPAESVINLSKSGWIDKSLFFDWIRHFNRQRKITSDGFTLLIMDGHSSHMSLETLKFTAENKIILLCLPSHSTHFLQPLDRTVYKSLKTKWSEVCAKYMRDHPGMVINRYSFCELFCKAYLASASMSNAVSGFAATGIWPFNSQAISEDAYGPAQTTHKNISSTPATPVAIGGEPSSVAATKSDQGSEPSNLIPAAVISKSKKQKATTSKKSNVTVGIDKNSTEHNEQRSNPNNYCLFCNKFYYENVDDSVDENWMNCWNCQRWFHDSCGGNAVKSANDSFCSINCRNNVPPTSAAEPSFTTPAPGVPSTSDSATEDVEPSFTTPAPGVPSTSDSATEDVEPSFTTPAPGVPSISDPTSIGETRHMKFIDLLPTPVCTKTTSRKRINMNIAAGIVNSTENISAVESRINASLMKTKHKNTISSSKKIKKATTVRTTKKKKVPTATLR